MVTSLKPWTSNNYTLSLFIETLASAIALIPNGKIAKAKIMVLKTLITVKAYIREKLKHNGKDEKWNISFLKTENGCVLNIFLIK
jgi:hypothetical protein